MIIIDLELTDVPYELNVQEMIDHIRLILAEMYGVMVDVDVDDVDLVNILRLARENKGQRTR